MNYIFISPNYPEFFYKFPAALKKKGARVFGVGDSGFICNELKNAVDEYIVIPNMTNYSALEAVVGQIAERCGDIAGIDSINEFWLESESRLREKFHVDGAKGELMQDYKFKSRMKSRFAKANVPAAPWVKSSNKNDVLDFANQQGFPLFCKPDNGVGAEGTHKFCDVEQLMNFLNNNNFAEFIFEPFVDGEIFSFDGLCDKDGELVFTAAHRFYTPIDELKQSGSECVYRALTDIPTTLFEEGSRTVKAFELKNSFFHIEFFKLNKAIEGVAKVGEFVALEANMRIAGGYTAEMIYNALGLDIYALWAAVVGGEKPNLKDYTVFPTKRAVVNVSRKNGRTYKYTPQQLKDAFANEYILGAETAKDENPFGNYEMVAAFTDENRLDEFVDMALEKI